MYTYGTLKRGGSNFDRFCSGASRVDDATTIGRLHFFPPHYPILDVPRENILGEASRRLSDDIELLARVDPISPDVLASEDDVWFRIKGEVVEFDVDAEQRLARVDWLEDFDVDGPSPSYHRVIIPVQREDGEWVAAWTYVIPLHARGRYRKLDDDSWSE